MKLLKRILRSDAAIAAICWIGSLYIRLAFHTSRWTVENDGEAQRLWTEGKPFILAFWHGRLLMMPYVWRQSRPGGGWRRAPTIHMLISAHRDGRLIAGTVSHFGIETAEGSSTRGGTQALRVMVKAMRNGEYAGITPDGPGGPRMRIGGGIVELARLSGAPILPATFSVTRARVLGSWDRFLLAWPFSRGVFLWGDPIHVARDADDAALAGVRGDLESAMNRLCAEADRRCGRPAIEPADPSEPPRKQARKLAAQQRSGAPAEVG